MEFDEFLERYIGKCGVDQILVLLLLACTSIFTGFNTISPVVISATPDHWCKSGVEIFNNCSLEDRKKFALPVTTKDGEKKLSACEMYKRNYSVLSHSAVCPTASGNGFVGNGTSSNTTVTEKTTCSSWIYSSPWFSHTIVTEWDLVCSKAALAGTVASVYMAGFMVGHMVFGPVVDRFGRRKPLIVSGTGSAITGIILAFSPNIAFLLVARFLLGCFIGGMTATSILMATELFSPSWRAKSNVVTGLGWVIGYVGVSALGAFIFNWRWIQLAISVPHLLFQVVLIFLLPESPRWLLAVGREKDAMKIMQKTAKMSKVQLPEKLDVTVSVEREAGNVLELFRWAAFRYLALILMFIWATNSFVYYGISLYAPSLGGNLLLNNCINGLMEIPAYFGMMLLFDNIGHVKPFAIVMLACGGCMFVTIFLGPSLLWLTITLTMLGKLLVAMSFGMAYIYTIEVFPTSMRAVGVNIGGTAAKVASIISPYIEQLSSVDRSLPLLVCAIPAIISGVLAFALPEMKDAPMLQTVQEGQKYVIRHGFLPCKQMKAWLGRRQMVPPSEPEEHVDEENASL